MPAFTGEDQEYDGTHTFLYAFLAMQMFGFGGNLIMLSTVLISKNVTRQPTWISFSVGWVISTLSYCLLLFSRMTNATSPPHTLCAVQAALIYAVPPMTAATTLGLAVQVWLHMRKVLKLSIPQTKTYIQLLLGLPYILFLGFFIAWLVVGFNNPDLVERADYKPYCDFKLNLPSRISAILVFVTMLPTLFFAFSTGVSLRCNWDEFRDRQGSISAVVRIIAFTICGIIGIVSGLAFITMDHHGSELNIIISILPVAAVLIFGSQSDMVSVLLCRGKSTDRRGSETMESMAPAGRRSYPGSQPV